MKNSFYLLMMGIILISFSCTPKYTASFGPSQKFYDGESKSKVLIAGNDKIDIPVESTSESFPTEDKSEADVRVNEEKFDQSLTASSKKEIRSPYEAPKVQELIAKYENVESEIKKSNLTSKEQMKAIKKEKRQLGKEVKKELKREIKEIRKSSDDDEYILMMILAIIIPPLGVGLAYGITPEFWISLILTLIFWLPGAIYSIIKVHQKYKG